MTDHFALPHVRILGQAFSVKHWTPTVLIICECSAKEPLLLASTAVCPACQRRFTLQGMRVAPGGTMQFAIGVEEPKQAS